MDKQTLLSLYDSSPGTADSVSTAALHLADVLVEGHQNLHDIVDLWAEIYALYDQSVQGVNVVSETAWDMDSPYYPGFKDYYDITESGIISSMRDKLRIVFDSIPDDYLVDGRKVITVNDGYGVYTVKFSLYAITLNGCRILSVSSAGPWSQYLRLITHLPSELSPAYSDVRRFLYTIISGYGVVENYGAMLRKGSELLSATGEDKTATLAIMNDYISSLQWLTGEDKEYFKSNLSYGLRSLVQSVSIRYATFQKEAEQAVYDQETTFLSSTAISVANFAPGMLLGLLTTVLDVVSMVTLALGRVVFVVLKIGQVILEAVLRFVLGVTTDYNETKFDIHFSKESVDSCFSFCIDQSSNVVSPEIARYMRELGYSRITLSPGKFFPLNYYIFLSYPDDDDISSRGGMINVETHLSLMFDLFKGDAVYIRPGNVSQSLVTLFDQYHGSPLGSEFYSYLGRVGNAVGDYGGSGPNAYLLNYEGKYLLLSFIEKYSVDVPFDSNPVSLPFMGVARFCTDKYLMNPYELMNYAYSPVSFSGLAPLLELWEDGNQVVLYRRLCSALILLYYYYFGYHALNTSGNAVDAGNVVFPCFNPNDGEVSWGYGSNTCSITLLKLGDFLKGLLGPILSSNDMVTFNNNFTSMHGNLDSVINGISILFNMVLFPKAIRTDVAASSIHISCYRIYSKSGENASLIHGSTNYSFESTTVQPQSFPAAVNFCLPYIAYGPSSGSVSMLSTEFIINAWPTGFLVDIPRLTFSGFLLGLIVDGLIVAVAAVITYHAVKGVIKLRNKAAQLQARTEGAWWKYHDDYDSSGTPEAKAANEARWKDYKRTRLKSNILGICAGTGTMSLGMYTESDDTKEGIISKLSGFTSPADSSDDPGITLASISRLIDGN